TLEEKSETGFRDPYGFTGKELEVDLGIMYFGARWYNPQLGRWLSPDPLYLVSTAKNAEKDQNIYHYAGNNPWKFVDPDGLQSAGPESRKNQQTVTSKINHGNGYEGSERFAKQVSGALGDIAKGTYDFVLDIAKAYKELVKDAQLVRNNPQAFFEKYEGNPKALIQMVIDRTMMGLSFLTAGSSSILGKLVFSFATGYFFGRGVTAGAEEIKQGNKTKGGLYLATTFIGAVFGIKFDYNKYTSKLKKAADNARDALARQLRNEAKKTGKRPPAAVVGGYNVNTGKVTAAASDSNLRMCCEAVVESKIGSVAKGTRITRAKRPRILKEHTKTSYVPVCERCSVYYPRWAFPDKKTVFKK
ncbi:RHS repeat-associated core domain-containing protein, partial [Myxococcota bacterium]|nr:RHS repeat-associated core domain-containing protein [Myxococcota bacterium]